MSSSVAFVVIVPEEGDRFDLLEEGPHGYRSPMMREWSNGVTPNKWSHRRAELPDAFSWTATDRAGLVVGSEGEPLPPGLFAITRLDPSMRHKVGHAIQLLLYREDPPEWALDELSKFGTVVILDADREEVRP